MKIYLKNLSGCMSLMIISVLSLSSFHQNGFAVIHGFSDELSRRSANAVSFQSIGLLVVDIGEKGGKIGTGILISPSTVLTVAHNFIYPFNPQGTATQRIIFTPNSENSEDTPFRPYISERNVQFRLHPQNGYDANGICSGVDLAIVKLDTPVGIKPARMGCQEMPSDSSVTNTEDAMIIGYGAYRSPSNGQETEDYLKRRANIGPIFYDAHHHQLTCTHRTSGSVSTFIASEHQSFFGIPTNHDSGSPLIYKKNIIGIYHGSEYFPALETQIQKWIPIAPFLDWIQGTVQELTNGRESIVLE